MQRRTEVDTPQRASQWGDRELAGQGVSRVGLSSRNRDLRAFDQQKSLDNQVRFQRLDEAGVETYADAVNRGDRFPDILVRREERSMSDWTANHLFGAYARNQRSGIPSYDVFVSGMQATRAGLPGERAVRRAEHRGRAAQPCVRPDGLGHQPGAGHGGLYGQRMGVTHALEQAPGRPASGRGRPAAQRVGQSAAGGSDRPTVGIGRR